MRFCGGTNYEGHTLSEIRKEFREICFHSKEAIALTKNIRWAELPMDLASVFADVTGLAQRIQEERIRNYLFLFGLRPSKSFVSSLRELGRRGITLHREIGQIWHQSGGYARYGGNGTEAILYAELRDFCCWVMDLDNMGSELEKRFIHMETKNNSGIMAGGNITAGGDIIVRGGGDEPGHLKLMGMSLVGFVGTVAAGVLAAGIIYWLKWN